MLPSGVARDELGVPRTTHATWRTRGLPALVSLDDARTDDALVLAEAGALRAEREIRKLRAILRLLTATMLALDVSLQSVRVPAERDKSRILRALDSASAFVPKAKLCALIGLSLTRARAWREREKRCLLDDQASCPRSHPTRLTRGERATIGRLFVADELKHFSVHALRYFAALQRLVHASYATWLRVIRAAGLARPRARVHPKRPRVGLRAKAPAEWLHIDVSVLRLRDGAKAYLQAVVDNFSRRVLSFAVTPHVGGEHTKAMLVRAIADLPEGAEPKLMSDGGSENAIARTDFTLASAFEHIVAQADVAFSNSMVEALWSQMKHRWLFLHTLDSIETVERLVALYVRDHYAKIRSPCPSSGVVRRMRSTSARAPTSRPSSPRPARPRGRHASNTTVRSRAARACH
jgi:putative transposase